MIPMFRLNSDIDINIHYSSGFYFNLPKGRTQRRFRLKQSLRLFVEELKNDVERAFLFASLAQKI